MKELNELTTKTDNKYYKYGTNLSKWVHNRFFKKPGKILDIGCGNGHFSLGFKKLGYNVYGVDFEKRAIESIKKLGIKPELCNLEKDKLSFKNNYFDYVFCRNTVEHIENYQNLFSEIKRVLKNNGELFVLVPDFATKFKIFYKDPIHLKPYVSETLRRIARYFDFKVIYLNKFKHPPFIWRYFNNIFNLRIPWGKQDLVFVGENVK